MFLNGLNPSHSLIYFLSITSRAHFSSKAFFTFFLKTLIHLLSEWSELIQFSVYYYYCYRFFSFHHYTHSLWANYFYSFRFTHSLQDKIWKLSAGISIYAWAAMFYSCVLYILRLKILCYIIWDINCRMFNSPWLNITFLTN